MRCERVGSLGCARVIVLWVHSLSLVDPAMHRSSALGFASKPMDSLSPPQCQQLRAQCVAAAPHTRTRKFAGLSVDPIDMQLGVAEQRTVRVFAGNDEQRDQGPQ
jgi:hypothetical protein